MIADLLAPIRCVACGVTSDGDLCVVCAGHLHVLVPPQCTRCGSPTRRPVDACLGCSTIGGFERSRSLVAYGGPASRLALALKHRGRSALGGHIGDLLADLAVSAGLGSDAVAFVPAGERARARGYDHAELIARAVARRLHAPLCPALVRTDSRRRQSETSGGRRRMNAAGAFRSRPVAGRILLVDDVMTTGATVEAAATALRESGASSVDVVTWARTLRADRRRRTRPIGS